ncbi:MAG TPA: hypothetical protein VJN64_06580 [Terriglobales bacterium]|nr:hypothetical protein [Terriglobales bacterium]
MAPQEIAGGFWQIDHDFKPTLQITNVLKIAPLTVTPVLYMADGTPYSLGPYQLGVSGVVAIDLRSALEEAPAAIASHVSDYGSVRVKYDWHWANAITASVQNIDAPRSLNFTFELRTPPAATIPNSKAGLKQDKNEASVHSDHDKVRDVIEEGLWWKRDPGVEGFVALTNISAGAMPVSLELLGRHGEVSARKRLNLGPELTQVLQLSDLDPEKLIHAKAGGVRIEYSGTTHDLVVVGGLENGNEGYSANIPFGILADKPSPANPVSISAAGVMVGAPDPMMMFPAGTIFTPYVAMRNTSNRALLVSSSISFMEGSTARTVPVAPIKLRPGESRELDGNDILARAGLANFNGSVNLGFSFNGDGNDLLLATGSVDQKGTYVLPVEATGNGESESKWLKYWSVANGDDTMISLFNPGDKPEDLQMTLFFMDGQYKVPIHLDPKGSTMLMLGEIITAHRPDADGHTIPFFIHQGSAILSGAGGMGELINVSVSSSIFNVANATCGSLCPTCLGIVDFSVSPSSTSTNVGGMLNYTATETNTSGGTADVTTRASWSSTNSSVGSLQSAGAYKGMAVGGFVAIAQLAVITPNPDCPEGQHNPCPTDPGDGSGGGNVTPTVTIQGLNFIFVGHDPTVVENNLFAATGSPSGGTYSWSTTAGQASFDNPTSSRVHLTVGSFSPSGATISVTYTANGQSATATNSITTRIFKFLQQATFFNVSTFNGPNTFGYDFHVSYNVFTSPNAQLLEPGFPGIVTTEAVTTTSSNVTFSPNISQGSTDANSQIGDELQLLSNAPLPANLSIVESQDIGVGAFFVRTNTLTWTATEPTITNDGPFN